MTEKRFDLLVVGEINPDLILRGRDPRPVFGQTEKLVDTATLTVGASSAIFACAAARLGLRTAFAGLVGDDPFGRFMLDELAGRGVEVSGCEVDDALGTGVSVILDDPSSDEGRAILTAPGTMARFGADHVDPKLIAAARHVHCGGYFLLPALRPGLPGLLELAGRAGATRSLDTNWDPEDAWRGVDGELLERCDLLLPNAAEALRLARTESVPAAARRLARGGASVAVKMGAAGAQLHAGGRAWHAAPPRVEVVDTTGAGDCFDAGAIFGLLAGWEPPRTLALAVACGTLSTRGIGGTSAQPALEEALAVAETITVAEMIAADG